MPACLSVSLYVFMFDMIDNAMAHCVGLSSRNLSLLYTASVSGWKSSRKRWIDFIRQDCAKTLEPAPMLYPIAEVDMTTMKLSLLGDCLMVTGANTVIALTVSSNATSMLRMLPAKRVTANCVFYAVKRCKCCEIPAHAIVIILHFVRKSIRYQV